MARKLVVCLDGTGNEIGSNLSNVVKLYRAVEKSDVQRVYYDPGVGTIGRPGWWHQLAVRVQGVLGLAFGLGLDDNVLKAYSWLCQNWRQGDEIYLFGFSRGAYTARVLAGFIRLIGLLNPEQLNLCGYALVAYKNAGDTGRFAVAEDFARVTGSRMVRVRFVGVWETVSSVLTPRARWLFIPWPLTLPYTRNNDCVEIFRHAISIDERRRMFRLNHWPDPQPYVPDPRRPDGVRPQDIRQVWFAGVHSDVGGGYPDVQSGLAQFPLLWMAEQARAAGLALDRALLAALAGKAPALGGAPPRLADAVGAQAPPDPTAELHRSLTGPWWILEPLPKLARLKEWPPRRAFLGLYIPWAEPRPIPNRPWHGVWPKDPFFIHSSAVARIADCPDYRPVNLPEHFQIETIAGPPAPPLPTPPPYKPEGVIARVKRLFTTWPTARDWRSFAVEAGWLAIVLAVLGGSGGFVRWWPELGPQLLWPALIAFLYPALAGEALFRGFLLKPPSDGASGLGPAVLSALLFALWGPSVAVICEAVHEGPCLIPWIGLPWNPWFLACAFALGLACARLVLSTRSIWPAVALHWLVVMTWAALFAGPTG
jgi:uncharacterized protein (DUF2235 family)/membrane protease YdiL (CAAX protease family)